MKSKTITLTMTVRAPAGMKIAHIKREIATRINNVSDHFGAWELGLPDTCENSRGSLRIRASRLKRGG